MTLRLSNAFRSLLRQLGITPTIEGILDVLGAGFDFTFPDQVEVQMETPDPPENAGVYTMTSDARNILVTETAGGQSYAAVVLPAAESGNACRVAVSAGQKTCLVFSPVGQHVAIVSAEGSVDLLPYGDGRYCAGNDAVQLQTSLAYLIGSTSDTPDPAGSLWARVLHLQERSRNHYTMTLSSVIAGDAIRVGEGMLTAVAADPVPGEFLVGLDDAETAENLSDALNAIDGVTATVDDAVVSAYGPVSVISWNVTQNSGESFSIEPDMESPAFLPAVFGSLSERLSALENQGE